MRTTIDIPADLLRRVKAEAALQGIKLKDYVAQALRLALSGGRLADSAAEAREQYGRAQTVIGKGCVFPLIRGSGGPMLKDLTPERARQLLEDEDAEQARIPRGR